MNTQIENAFTVDVEDYYQVEGFKSVIERKDWANYPSRVASNNEQILKLLNKFDVKGTFFILGYVAEKEPAIVEDIIAEGHEVACHGYSHTQIFKQSQKEFREETIRAKSILENITGAAIKGYRAATYSITANNLWALSILIEVGFEYDSSIFPIRHDRYGIVNFSRSPLIITSDEGKIIEYPISTAKLLNNNFPVSGGGYFRLFPYYLTRFGLNSVNNEGNPFIFYMHPWEIDTGQPVIKGISRSTKFRHYVNIKKTERKINKLLTDFKFNRVDYVLQNLQLIEKKLIDIE